MNSSTRPRHIFRLARARRLVEVVRCNSTASSPMKGQWSIKSPKRLYDHLSSYIVGQERAKRVLSVAVFNHYLRITPVPPSEPNDATSTLDLTRAVVSSPASPPASTSTSASQRRDATSMGPDPSRAGAALDDGVRRDITRAVGGDGEGADPTLTHELLNSRSREGQWARDGFFSAARPSTTPTLLSKPRRRRTPVADDESFGLLSDRDRSGQGRNGHLGGMADQTDHFSRYREEVHGEAGQAGPSRSASRRDTDRQGRDADKQRQRQELDAGLKGGKGKQRAEEVVVEKSNVLMIGPTGTGKTLMAKTLARILDVPFASCDATTYTQAGYVGEDVENCVLRLLQNAEYDVGRAEVGIIHIDEVDKLARRGGGEFGSWGGGRDVGGEGVQQALLRLLEGTTLTLTAKPPALTSSTSSTTGSTGPLPTSGGLGGSGANSGKDTLPKAEAAAGGPPEWDPNNPMNRGFGVGSGKKGVREGLPGFGGGGGGSSGGKGETFVVDTTNILFVLSGAFVGLESIVNRRLGKGSIGFGAPLPLPPVTSSTMADISPTPLKGLATADLATYGLIPEFLGRLPVLSTLHPLSIDDLVRILTEPKNALVKQYQANFEKLGSELQFTDGAIRQIAKTGLDRGGGARGLRGILEEVLLDAMYEVPDSSIRYLLITENVVNGSEPAHYFSRGQRVTFLNMLEEENAKTRPSVSREEDAESAEQGGSGVHGQEDEEVEDERLRASG